MIRAIYLDCNNTLEDFDSIKKETNSIISFVASEMENRNIIINVDYAVRYLNYLQKNVSKNAAWINHPIYWRGVIKNEVNETILNEVYRTYLNQYELYITLFDDVLESLNIIKAHPTRLYLLANGNRDRLYRLINKYELNRYFDDFLISGETPFKKPESIMFNYLLKKENLSPENVIMVGDSYVNDIIGARNNNITSVLIKRKRNTYPAKNYLSNPDFTVYSLKTLPKLISKINSKSISCVPSTKNTEYKAVNTAVIMAGGKGSRLGDIGKSTNKCMLIIDEIPLLEHIIDSFKNIGVTNFVIAVSHLSEQITSYFGNGENFSINIKYVTGKFQSTSAALKECMPFIDEVFYYCHGNIFFQNSFLSKITADYLINHKNVVSCLKGSNEINHIKVKPGHDNVVSSISKDKSELTFSGLALYKKDTFLSNSEQISMVDEFISKAIEKGQIIRYVINFGYYYHIQTEQDYFAVAKFLT